MNDISAEMVRALLDYDPETGLFKWRTRPVEMFADVEDKRGPTWAMNRWNTRHANKEAFTADHCSGYRRGTIFSRLVLAHRVAWAWVYGEWPSGFLDHKNGDRGDNRIKNLRLVDYSTNNRNQRNRNKNGWPGVYSRNGKWQAFINVGGKPITIGTFEKVEAAIAARKAAELEYWGPNVRT